MHDRRFPGSPGALRAPGRMALLEVDQVLDLCLQAFPAQSALDVGTGTGIFAEGFARRGLEVAGIDVNPAMIEAARRLVPDGRFRHAPAEAIPYAERSFDLVFLGLVLHETDDAVQALREARRVSASGVAALEWPYEEQGYGPPLGHRIEPGRLLSLAAEAGFAGVETLPLTYLVLYLFL